MYPRVVVQTDNSSSTLEALATSFFVFLWWDFSVALAVLESSIDQAVLELRDMPVSAYPVLGLKARD